jgi:hypothetical protein
MCSLGHVQVHKNGLGVPGAVLGSALVCPKKPAQKRPLNIYEYGFFPAPQMASLEPKAAHRSSANQPAWPCTAFGMIKARAPTSAIFVAVRVPVAVRPCVAVWHSGAVWCHTDVARLRLCSVIVLLFGCDKRRLALNYIAVRYGHINCSCAASCWPPHVPKPKHVPP